MNSRSGVCLTCGKPIFPSDNDAGTWREHYCCPEHEKDFSPDNLSGQVSGEVERDRDEWKGLAQLLGENLSSVGPDGYYDFTPSQFRSWLVSLPTIRISKLPQAKEVEVCYCGLERENHGSETHPFTVMEQPSQALAVNVPSDGMTLIASERRRQIESEGWTPEHDDDHGCEELALAAAAYAIPDTTVHLETIRENIFPRSWHRSWWKPTPENRVRELVKAGALIAAEIDRLRRLTSQHGGRDE